MKRTILSLFLVLALLVSVVAGALLCNLVSGNFMPFPTAPSKDPPKISIELPENQTFVNSNTLNFTLIKPDSWNIVYDWVDGT